MNRKWYAFLRNLHYTTRIYQSLPEVHIKLYTGNGNTQ